MMTWSYGFLIFPLKLQTAEIPMRFWHFLDLPFKEVRDLQDVNLFTVMLEAKIFCVFSVLSFTLEKS